MRLFLIVLTPIVSVVLGLSAHSIIASPESLSVVKDESTTLPSEQDIASPALVEDSLATDNKPIVTVYTVATGDTLSGIAEKFDISTNTIRWANNLCIF